MGKKTSTRSARNKMMDLLAIRDHSEKEIRKKLKDRDFSNSEIDAAVEYARNHNWLPNNPQEQAALAEKMASGLHRKNKGVHYINHHLREKGLPEISLNKELELQKAINAVKTKFSEVTRLSQDEKAKIGRFLMSRGFDMDTVKQIVYKR